MVLTTAFSCAPTFVEQHQASALAEETRGHVEPPKSMLRSTRSEPIPRGADQEDVCWICLEPAGQTGTLERPCECPRSVHSVCLARWQLHSAGRDEERTCRFCHTELRDWKPVMTKATNSKMVTPYMRVSFNGKTYKVQVQPGKEGAEAFEQQIRGLLQLPEDLDFDVIFHCRAPGTGDKLQLQGLNAFDAAVHCASLSNKPPGAGASGSVTSAGPARKLPRRSSGGPFGRLLAAFGCSTITEEPAGAVA